MAKRSISQTLGEEREMRKVSLADLAERSGIAETIIAEIEAGNHDPSHEERAMLSRALGTPLPSVSGEVLENLNGSIVRTEYDKFEELIDCDFSDLDFWENTGKLKRFSHVLRNSKDSMSDDLCQSLELAVGSTYGDAAKHIVSSKFFYVKLRRLRDHIEEHLELEKVLG